MPAGTRRRSSGLVAGKFCVNAHTQPFPGGELRSQIVPDPATVLLLGAGSLLLGRRRRLRRAWMPSSVRSPCRTSSVSAAAQQLPAQKGPG
ncbi:MAG: PEP-CTERM sorting domain-containing protein [Phycisphaerae bacterium]